MKRSKRIKIVVDLAERELEKAGVTLREVQNQRDQIYQQFQDLNSYYAEYLNGATGAGASFVPIQLQTSLAFIQKLKQALDDQENKLNSYNEYVAKAREQWLEKKLRFDSLTKVFQKLLKDEEKALSKQEQKMLDELSSQQFYQKNSSELTS